MSCDHKRHNITTFETLSGIQSDEFRYITAQYYQGLTQIADNRHGFLAVTVNQLFAHWE